MFNNIINNFKNLDTLIKSIMKIGLRICFALCIISLIFLITYNSFYVPFLYNIGFILFKLSLIFGVEFIICGFVVDKIKAGVI